MGYKYDATEILEQGVDLLRLQGYNRTGINDMLKVAGIPKGSFYNFFSSKQDFGLKAIRLYSDFVVRRFEAHLSDEQYSPLDRLRNHYADITRLNTAEEFQKGCLLCNLATELGSTEPALSQAIETEYDRWIELISACVAEGQQMGEITNAYSADEIAAILNNSYAGALARMKVSQSVEPLLVFEKTMFDFIAA